MGSDTRWRRQWRAFRRLSLGAAVIVLRPPNFSIPTPSVEQRQQKEQRLEQRLEQREEEIFEIFSEDKWWNVPASWPRKYANAFVALGPDDAAADFVLEPPMAGWHLAKIYETLCELPLNEFDLQAVLYPPGSHLISKEQLVRLFAHANLPSKLRILDIGAGDGCITRDLSSFGELVATETSFAMACRLRLNGFKVWAEDVAETGEERARSDRFELVSMLNVLDRCASPKRLLSAARHLCCGHLLLASPLPFVASYYGPQTDWSGVPNEKLDLGPLGPLGTSTWEEDAKMLLDFLPSCGFQPVAVSRLPYLSGGDELDGGCTELDDIIILARRF